MNKSGVLLKQIVYGEGKSHSIGTIVEVFDNPGHGFLGIKVKGKVFPLPLPRKHVLIVNEEMRELNMAKIETLLDNKWLSVEQKTYENGSKYVYSTQPWCKDTVVVVLPYRITGGKIEYLARYEKHLAHDDELLQMGAIMGGYDNSDKFNLAECALNELREEGGYDAEEKHLVLLGTVQPSKASKTTMHLYAVNVGDEGVTKCEATGDGTFAEQGAFAEWVDEQAAVFSVDPLLATMICRLAFVRCGMAKIVAQGVLFSEK